MERNINNLQLRQLDSAAAIRAAPARKRAKR